MKRYKVTYKGKALTWTFYNCNDLLFMESNKNDYIKLSNYFQFLRSIVLMKLKGAKVENLSI
jgi:hypothetical protein